MCEMEASSSARFITLTYDDENLPRSFNGLPTLKSRDFQHFMMRLRTHINTHIKNKKDRPKIKYYACGEYGSHTERPHYHAIVFNLPDYMLDNSSVIQDIWSNGHISSYPVKPGAIFYVVKYMMKELRYSERDELDDRQEEKSLMSKGLGKSYVTKNRKEYYKRNLLPYLIKEGGEKQAMPRYIKNLIYNQKELKILQRKAIRHLESIDTLDKFDSYAHEIDWKKVQFQINDKQARERAQI